MTNSDSDALVFFGATGDLAYKKIPPRPWNRQTSKPRSGDIPRLFARSLAGRLRWTWSTWAGRIHRLFSVW